MLFSFQRLLPREPAHTQLVTLVWLHVHVWSGAVVPHGLALAHGHLALHGHALGGRHRVAVAAHGPVAAGGHAHGAVGQAELAGPGPLHRHMVGPFEESGQNQNAKVKQGLHKRTLTFWVLRFFLHYHSNNTKQ